MLWDVFCRVIDNHGDLGVCWRLAVGLAARGERVRLWVDDPTALTWMAPAGCDGVQTLHWFAEDPDTHPADVVIEAFGCDPPAGFVARMHRHRPPVWINLEYLSAESYVERSHGLPSPQQNGPGAGLTKWFFYPGFSRATGGLLREPGLIEQVSKWERLPWLAAHGLAPDPGEILVSLFCYAGAPVERLLEWTTRCPSLLLVPPGPPRLGIERALGIPLPDGARTRRGGCRIAALPYLTQVEFDYLLWSCDLNFVRGEDSLVRAIWAGRPFVWQAYPQHDHAHVAKVDACLRSMAAEHAEPAGTPSHSLRTAWLGWNRACDLQVDTFDCREGWQPAVRAWRGQLTACPDLVTQLLRFVQAKAGGDPYERSLR